MNVLLSMHWPVSAVLLCIPCRAVRSPGAKSLPLFSVFQRLGTSRRVWKPAAHELSLVGSGECAPAVGGSVCDLPAVLEVSA